MVFSPDGSVVAAGGKDRQVHFWSAETGEPNGAPLTGHAIGVKSLAYSPDGRRVATGDDDTVRIWDAQTRELIGAPLTGHDDPVASLAFSPDGRLLASGSSDDTVRIWDAETVQQVGAPLGAEFQTSEQLVISPDGQRIVAVNEAGKLTTWPGPAQWANLLCRKLSANMSRAQWNQWVSPDIEYVVACPDLPVPE